MGLINSNNTFEKKGESSFSLSGSASEGSPNVLAGNLIHNLLRKKRTCRPCPFNGKNTCYDITWPPRDALLALLWKAQRGGCVFFSFHAAVPHSESFCCSSSILRKSVQFSSVQSLNRVQLFATPWTAAHQASLSITNSWSLLKLMSIESDTSHPLSSTFPPAFNLSQHQGLFQ